MKRWPIFLRVQRIIGRGSANLTKASQSKCMKATLVASYRPYSMEWNMMEHGISGRTLRRRCLVTLITGIAAQLACNLNAAEPQAPAAAIDPAEFYVAPAGDDGNPGTAAMPFATLERARDAVRVLKRQASGPLPNGITVWLRGGTYPRRTSFTLSSADSGTTTCPITWSSSPGEVARLFGGTILDRSWFTPVTDKEVLARVISVEARRQLVSCDLRSHGITEYGEMSRRGFGQKPGKTNSPATLYVGNQRMTLARWPNPGQHFPEMLCSLDKQRKGVVARKAIIDPGPGNKDVDYREKGGAFSYAFDRPAFWTKAEDPWLDGVFSWSWEWSYNRVSHIDVDKKLITLRYGEYSRIKDVYSGNWFFAENLLEEIDEPGEYWIDRGRGVLYLLPNAAFLRGDTVHLSALADAMVAAQGLSHVTFNRLSLDSGRGDAIAIRGGNQVRLDHCAIARFAGSAIAISGERCTVSSCLIHDIGSNGIVAGGGDTRTLKPAGHVVENCDLHDWGWHQRVYTAGVTLEGVGQQMSHNRMRHGPHAAILLRGNDHVVEYNDIAEVCQEFIDLGAIYINVGNSPLERGWIIRRNYFHDIAAGPDAPLNVQGVYIDHGSSGGLIDENVFHRMGSKNRDSVSVVASGLHTTVRHNLFVDCTTAMEVSCKPAPVAYLEKRYADYQWAKYFSGFDLINMPHLMRYPEVRALLPHGPVITEKDMWNRFEGNIIWNPAIPRKRPEGIKIRGEESKDTPVTPMIATGNWTTDIDPGCVDAQCGDFTLQTRAPAFIKVPGFPAVPFKTMGMSGQAGP